MHIDQYLDLVLEAGVKQPLNLVLCSVHAANIRSVLVDSPVTDRKSDSLDLSISECFNIILSVPVVVVSAHPPVRILIVIHRRSSLLHHFAESVGIKSHIALLLVQEGVEHRGRDPRLQHEPTTQVDSVHCRCLNHAVLLLLMSTEECHYGEGGFRYGPEFHIGFL